MLTYQQFQLLHLFICLFAFLLIMYDMYRPDGMMKEEPVTIKLLFSVLGVIASFVVGTVICAAGYGIYSVLSNL